MDWLNLDMAITVLFILYSIPFFVPTLFLFADKSWIQLSRMNTHMFKCQYWLMKKHFFLITCVLSENLSIETIAVCLCGVSIRHCVPVLCSMLNISVYSSRDHSTVTTRATEQGCLKSLGIWRQTDQALTILIRCARRQRRVTANWSGGFVLRSVLRAGHWGSWHKTPGCAPPWGLLLVVAFLDSIDLIGG